MRIEYYDHLWYYNNTYQSRSEAEKARDKLKSKGVGAKLVHIQEGFAVYTKGRNYDGF